MKTKLLILSFMLMFFPLYSLESELTDVARKSIAIVLSYFAFKGFTEKYAKEVIETLISVLDSDNKAKRFFNDANKKMSVHVLRITIAAVVMFGVNYVLE